MTPIAFNGEVMLLDWSETAKGGAKIVLQLDGPEALEPFRMMTLAKKGVAGQRFMCALALIGDDETPVAVKNAKGGPMSVLAARWCASGEFRVWFGRKYAITLRVEEDAAALVRTVCHVNSRAELDHDELARQRFQDFIRGPYMAHLAEHGA